MTDDGGQSKRGGGLWKWAVGAVIVALIVWQVGHGVFVKSVTAPGGAAVAFYPKPQADPGAGNEVHQTGSKNEAGVHGRDNTVEQHGEGNKATID